MQTAASRLSSFFTNRLRAVLWIAVGAAAIALVVAVVVGLRPHHAAPPNVRRTLVSDYIVQVGRIQQGMALQVRAIDKEYKAFAKNPATAGTHTGQYVRAERTLVVLRKRLGKVEAPREARKLNTLILRLADENILAARAVAAIASYIPALTVEQTRLRTAILKLQKSVAASKTAKSQAIAFTEYAATTKTVGDTVAKLRPPSFFVAARNAELSQLHTLSSLATEISAALTQKHLALAQKLLGRLGQIEADTSVVRAQRTGALAYNARLKAMNQLTKQIELQRKLLEKRVPA
jgi:hypothetical protein